MNISDTIEYLLLWNRLSDVVLVTCEGRDDSHGYNHMLTVVKNALKIFEHEMHSIDKIYHDQILKYIIIVAWLHDVADHKYDKDDTLKNKVRNFINTLVSDDETELICNIIDHISYSKENKAILSGHPIEFHIILGEIGSIVRDIVSDADKLEALGKIGFERCVEYQKHYYKEKHNKDIPYDLLKLEVKHHANEKLLRLKDEFIRTDYGKELAKPLHDELVNELNQM
ncbi:HD superfamily phosphodieaserase [Fadolivirus algeromassiliense]|jgi:uncharacterized protein|uniref:HD superfamily phosphodieaserase n=1 Tax=Fadolivirus FV1/VV64 TaxID=3070911 RepID=A0A7D3USJ5_9VIRU|nr:HD superfamily phosphodieaserase [Fadolivirus algeromassiliense]QKF93610.1 HD superfamily phosphodieaserase [Fadolivirus FV1/VV64]